MTPNESQRPVSSAYDATQSTLQPALDSTAEDSKPTDSPALALSLEESSPQHSRTYPAGLDNSQWPGSEVIASPVNSHLSRTHHLEDRSLSDLVEFAPDVIDLPSLGSHLEPLSSERKLELKILAGKGINRIENKVLEALRHPPRTKLLAGMEIEQSAVNIDTFEPAFVKGPDLLRQVKAADMPNTTAELLAHQLEHNGAPFEIKPGCLIDLENRLRRYDEQINTLANSMDMAVISTGLLPSLRADQMTIDKFSDGQRYAALTAALEEAMQLGEPYFSRSFDAKKGRVLTRFEVAKDGTPMAYVEYGDKKLVINNVTLALEGAMTSMQVHIDIPHMSQATSMHRVADMVSPAISAVTAGSPHLFGHDTGLAELRTLVLWQISTSPFRSGFISREWMNEPTDQLRQANSAGALIEPSQGGKSAGAELPADVNAGFQVGKTIWPHNRINFHFSEPEETAVAENTSADEAFEAMDISAVLEVRCASAAATVTDQVAHFALTHFGIKGVHSVLTEGMPAKLHAPLQGLDTLYHCEDTRDDFMRACADGLDADFVSAPGNFGHVTGNKISARDYILNTLIPCAKVAWLDQLESTEELDRSLQPIIDRLNFDWGQLAIIPEEFQGKIGATQSDIQRYLDLTLPLKEPQFADQQTRAAEITRLLVAANEYDRRTARETGTGSGILGWFKHYTGLSQGPE